MPETDGETALPTIDTERLTLRVHRVEDFSDSAAMWGDPNVMRYIGGRTLSTEEVWTRLLRYAGHWSLMGFGYWVIREKASGRFAGEVGFADYKRDLKPSLEGAPEIGWSLAPWAWGKGFATEAVRAVVAWGATRFGSARTVCLINPENLQSIRVAQKCGYQESGPTTYNGLPTLIFDSYGPPKVRQIDVTR
jgi:RimJ/RimL family protein N-acetyltransferase